jgi:excisionase family DNA binding protein
MPLHSDVTAPAGRSDRLTPAPRHGSQRDRPVLLNAAEAAELLTAREATVYDMARRGDLPCVRIGRLVRFVEADLVEWIDGLRVRPKGTLVDESGRRSA